MFEKIALWALPWFGERNRLLGVGIIRLIWSCSSHSRYRGRQCELLEAVWCCGVGWELRSWVWVLWVGRGLKRVTGSRRRRCAVFFHSCKSSAIQLRIADIFTFSLWYCKLQTLFKHKYCTCQRPFCISVVELKIYQIVSYLTINWKGKLNTVVEGFVPVCVLW